MLLAAIGAIAAKAADPVWRSEELRRWPAPEANQAVAVDASHFYAIGNHVIGKYDKKTGKRVAEWACEKGRPLIHLNSGIIRDGILYCAHSKYPTVPMVSSIEMWDTRTLRHSGTHSFGIVDGSATWIDFRQNRWYVTFGHYASKAGEPNRDARYTSLVEFDLEWRRLQGWAYPEALTAKLGTYTISGGTFGPDGRLFCTGHDNPEIYVLQFADGGGSLVLESSFAAPNPGQGIAWDPSEAGILYSIDSRKREIIVTSVKKA
jgi:hypothetical protein